MRTPPRTPHTLFVQSNFVFFSHELLPQLSRIEPDMPTQRKDEARTHSDDDVVVITHAGMFREWCGTQRAAGAPCSERLDDAAGHSRHTATSTPVAAGHRQADESEEEKRASFSQQPLGGADCASEGERGRGWDEPEAPSVHTHGAGHSPLGMAMMLKKGWKPGQALGRDPGAVPIRPHTALPHEHRPRARAAARAVFLSHGFARGHAQTKPTTTRGCVLTASRGAQREG